VTNDLVLDPIATVRSSLRSRRDAPRLGSEGAPDAWLDVEPRLARALDGIHQGDEVMVITWLHLAPTPLVCTV
jgi:tRNA (Thr-GGU) A37 N-methylase